jgi:hypothetical protein
VRRRPRRLQPPAPRVPGGAALPLACARGASLRPPPCALAASLAARPPLTRRLGRCRQLLARDGGSALCYPP